MLNIKCLDKVSNYRIYDLNGTYEPFDGHLSTAQVPWSHFVHGRGEDPQEDRRSPSPAKSRNGLIPTITSEMMTLCTQDIGPRSSQLEMPYSQLFLT